MAYGIGGHDDQAIADYTKALEINPKYYDAYNNRAHAYFKKGQDDRAIADYTRALEINPRYNKAYYTPGYAYFKEGHNDRARADLEQAAKLDRDLLSRCRTGAKGDEASYLELLKGK